MVEGVPSESGADASGSTRICASLHRTDMGHRFHSGVALPTVEIVDPIAAADLIDPDAAATHRDARSARGAGPRPFRAGGHA